MVSGGCLAIALAHLADRLEGGEAANAALYRRMREYTRWFEEKYGSTLCRERCGADLRKVSGFTNYLFTGKVFTRCVNQIGPAVEKIIRFVNQPLENQEESEVEKGDGEGLCAAPVLRRIREETGLGNRYMEDISIALDGGVGLSGGLCGALAGALLSMGMIWGIDPQKEGTAGTVRFFLRGHLNLYTGKGKKGLWAIAGPVVRDFRRRFGSLECGELTGVSFHDREELIGFLSTSQLCPEIKDWCATRVWEVLKEEKG